VVPEIDVLTNLLDRQSFTAVLEREIVRARLAGHPLSLLVLDVDRLTSLNARLGSRSPTRRCSSSARSGSRGASIVSTTRSAWVAGGSPAPTRLRGRTGRDLYEALRRGLRRIARGREGVSLPPGRPELVLARRRRPFAARADTALQEAKAKGRGTIVLETRATHRARHSSSTPPRETPPAGMNSPRGRERRG
jgi:predicted signal transduction protein with EAL and GGDEF domain